MTDPGPTPQTPSVQAQELPPRADAQESQPSDFRRIFEEHFGYVWRALGRLGVGERDLEDLTHDVFLQVYRRFSEFDPRRPLRPWLFGFAFRLALAHRRLARNRLEQLGHDSDPVDPAPSAIERLIQLEMFELAQAALETLELGRRAVFILHELDEVPMPEIARALGLPLNTAYSRLRLARKQFAASVQRLRRRRGDR
jgi:RNA polymerase sigma-70 factor (ECF subfamily)